MENTVLTFTVPSEYDGENAKTFLKKYCKLTTAVIIALKRVELGISRNGELLRTVDTVYENDVIKIKLPQDKNEIMPIKGDLNILYEDAYIVVVDKPPYMPVHPTKVHQQDTLANFLRYYSEKKGEHYTFRAINRLDRDTSGTVVIAKDRYTATSLFKSLDKVYCAVCEGEIRETGTIDKPIKVMEGRSIQRVVSDDGQRAVTHYTPIKWGNNHTLLDIKLETGRTHQIRCHFQSIGHPLAGDDMYFGSLEYIKRQALHCKSVTFVHPITNEAVAVTSQVPKDFLKILNP